MNINFENPRREKLVRWLKIRHCMKIAEYETRKTTQKAIDYYFVTMLVLELDDKGILPNRDN